MDVIEEHNSNRLIQGFGYRHRQCFILFLILVTSISSKACMGVALVAMTKVPVTNVSISNNVHIGQSEVVNSIYEDKHNGILQLLMLTEPYPIFNWSKKIQNVIFSSFFWGFMILQLPSGILIHRFGSRKMIFWATMVNSFIFVAIPLACYYGGWKFLIICRFIQGLSQSCIAPSINTFLGKWAPLQERGRLTGAVYGGHPIGCVLGILTTGLIVSSVGWPGIFYFCGILCGFSGLLVWLYLADTPSEHPKISDAERMYIENELGRGKVHCAVPWRKILSCRGVWAVIVAHTGQVWGSNTFFSEVPTYLDKILVVNITANSVLTATPYFFMWLSNYLFCYIVDLMINRKIFSVTTTRKIANSVGSIVPGLGLIALCYLPKNIYAIESVLILICSFKIAGYLGFALTSVDIAPNFSGQIKSLGYFLSYAIGSFSSVANGFILTDVTSESCWRVVFFVSAAFFMVCNLVFVALGSNDIADWNDPVAAKHKTDDAEESKSMID